MKRLILLLMLCLSVSLTEAQKISHSFRDVPMSEALKIIENSTKKYTINFIYNELEDFTVTTTVKKKRVPDAIKQIIGFYPIKMTVDSNNIFVECVNKSERKLIGRIVDNNNQPVIYANVALLNCADTTSFITGGVSNEAGQFVIPCKDERVRVRITCVGYNTIYRTMTVGDIGTIRMRPSSYILKNVIVKGDNVIKKEDRTIYLPTKKQVNASNSGIGLLFYLMIPQLNVDKINKSILSNDNKSVTLCINDREAQISEVNQLRPRDIARVEFLNYPTTGIYAGDRAVVNFVMKKYDTGGYVDARSMNAAIFSTGSFDTKLNIDNKKFNYTVLAGTSYEDDRKSGNDLTETYNFEGNSIVRNEQYVSGKYKDNMHYGLGRAEYNNKSVHLWGECGFVWDQDPLCRGTYNTSYQPQLFASSVTTNEQSTRTAKPYIQISGSKMFSENERLASSISYSYSHNDYNRTYTENTFSPIISNSKEDYHDINAIVDYSNSFKHRNNIRIVAAEFFKKSIGDYSGSNSSHQNLMTSELLAIARYNHGFGPKLNIMWRLGFDYTIYKLNQNDKKTFFNPRANTAINYSINKKSSLSFSIDYGNSFPQLSFTSEVQQKVNPLMTLKGNPDLKIMKFLGYDLNYDLTLGIYNFNAYSHLLSSFHNTDDLYYEDNGNMIHTYTNACNYFSFYHGISNTVYLLNKSLQIQAGLSLSQTFITKLYTNHENWFTGNMRVTYMTGNFSFGANYSSKSKMISTCAPTGYTESNNNYSLWASYSNKGFFVEAGTSRPFGNDYVRSWFDYGKYSFERKNYSDSYGPYVYVQLSYTFDFGRKINKNGVEIDRSTNSGMLHPQ